MKCLNCGSELPDGAAKCDVCGLKLRKKSSGAAVERLKMVGIGAGVGLVIVGAFAVPAFVGSASAQSTAQDSRVASDLVTQNELVVPAKALGLDASGSRIAVHVKGLTSGGTSVEQDGFVNQEGKGLALEQGMYEVTVVGSPISSSGVIYTLPTASVSVEVTAGGGSSYTSTASLDLTPVDAASVTDEQIESARQWALKDPERSSSADQLAEAARQRRAAAQKAADGNKKEGKQEGAQAQSDQSSGDSNNSSGQSSDNSNSSDNASSYNSDDSSYSYNGGNYNGNYGGNYADTQSNSGGNAADSNSNPGTPEQSQSGDAQPSDSSQSSGGGQQVDPAPPDSSSSSGTSSTDTGGSSADQGSSSSSSSAQPSQPTSGGTSASGNAPTA